MNADTIRGIAEIRKNGWYRKCLGEGGWGELYWAEPSCESWSRYLLFIGDEPEAVEEITARDDETAIKAFNELYRLQGINHDIVKKTVTLKTIHSEWKSEEENVPT